MSKITENLVDEYTCAVRRSSPVHNEDAVIDKPGSMHVRIVGERKGKGGVGTKGMKQKKKKKHRDVDNIATNYTTRFLTRRAY